MKELIFTLLWLFGIVLAKGFWSTFFAIFFPFWGVIVSVVNIVQMMGTA